MHGTSIGARYGENCRDCGIFNLQDRGSPLVLLLYMEETMMTHLNAEVCNIGRLYSSENAARELLKMLLKAKKQKR